MSRTREYGRSVAVQTTGPDAVKDVEAVVIEANEALGRNLMETSRLLGARGVELQWETLQFDRKVEPDRVLLSWVATGYQTRNLLSRILWAVKL